MGGTLLKEPYPHAVYDNFLPLSFADKIYKELKNIDVNEHWYKYDNQLEKKRATDRWELFPPNTAHFLMSTLAKPFISVIEEKFNIKGLIGDGALRGGGIHIHFPGTKLDIHKDFTFHNDLKLWRRVNAIWFANKEWDPEWNGFLELWNADMTECVRKIFPKFNRLVVFEAPNANHGLPDPLACPEGHRRMTLAMYYYTAEKPKNIPDEKRSTTFLRRPTDPIDPDIEALRERRSRGRLESNV